VSRDTEFLQRTLAGVNVRAFRQFTLSRAASATETPRMGNGIKLNGNGTLTLNGTTYTRDQFRAALEENMKAQRADAKSAYNDRRHPGHAAAVSEMQLGYKFLGGELTEADEKQIVNDWSAATQENEVTTLQPHQEIAQIVSSPEGKIALQRARTGQPLDATQKQIVQRHNELEALNNSTARREQASKGGTMSIRPPRSIGSDVQAWLNNPHKVQRQQLAAEFKTKTLANPDHDYWHPERGTLCDNAKLGTKIAYEVAETGDCHGVQIGADGAIEE
jgi:hypothetical protein